MKLSLNILAAAAALVVAGQASAALTGGGVQGGSSLVLSVWDNVANVSYTRNLGTNLNGFLPSGFSTLPGDGNVLGTAVSGDKTPNAGLSLTFTGDTLFGTTFASSVAGNIQWNVVAFDSVNSVSGGLYRFLTTTAPGNPPTTINSATALGATGATTYFDGLLSQTTIATTNSVAIADPGSAAFAGRANFGTGLNNLGVNSSGTGFGGSLDFYYLARTQVSGLNSALATQRQFGNAENFASWTLATDGTATYNLAPIAAVPLPPALWMFGSGLVTLAGFARRRKPKALTQVAA